MSRFYHSVSTCHSDGKGALFAEELLQIISHMGKIDQGKKQVVYELT